MTTAKELARIVLEKRNAADNAYKAWEKASPSNKVAAWQRYKDSEGVYYRAIHQANEERNG